MSQIFRVFIRHESDAQPAYIKVRSEQSHEDFVKELEDAVQKPAPSLWRCTDVDHHTWLFRADKIYTVCVYPPENENDFIEGGSRELAQVSPATDPGTAPVADNRTYDDLDAVEATEDPKA